jgi:hypothetical protein
MSGDVDVRAEVLRLRRNGWSELLAVGAALVVAGVCGFAWGGDTWIVWAVLLALGTWLYRVASKASRLRDAAVLELSDEAVRAYLRGRLDGLIARYSRVLMSIVAVPFVLLGVALVSAPRDRPDLLAFGAAFLSLGGALFVLPLWRRFVSRPALIRLRTAIGEGDGVPAPWVVEMARKIAAEKGETFAALFWHEATGVKMRDARSAVMTLPDAPSTTSAAVGPAPDVIRARIRAFARADLAGGAATIVVLAALAVTDGWGMHATREEIWRQGPSLLSGPQRFFAVLGVLVLLGAVVRNNMHRAALKAADGPMRTYYRRELDQRLARSSKWSPVQIALVVVAAVFVASAVVRIALDVVRDRPTTGVPWLVESLVFATWYVAMPWRAKRKWRPVLERERAEFVGPDEPPLIA